MATFTVTNSADSGAGTLRADLAGAGNGDTIDFATGLGPIDLASSLTISQNVTIEGGASGIVVDGGGKVPDFDVTSGNVNLDGLIIQNGYGAGASGNTYGAVTSAAGGIYDSSSGVLTVSNSTFTGDNAVGGAGEDAINSAGPFSDAPGSTGGSASGGIFVARGATLNLVGSNSFSGNSASGGNRRDRG